MLVFVIFLVVVIGLGIIVAMMYNQFVALAERVKNARGQIATQIESRWDALTNLISATKEYSKHESETLEKVIAQRASINENSSIEDIEKTDAQLNNVLGRLMAISESYPDLKASEVYKQTMENVTKFEDNVRHSRMIYNDVVTRYNRQLKQFPSNIIGSMFGFKEEQYFERSEEKGAMPVWN